MQADVIMSQVQGVQNDAFKEDVATDASEIEPRSSSKSSDKETEEKRREPLMSTKRILKNIIVISLVFLLNFTAYGGLSKLQSSLHRVDGLGVTCQAVLYATLCLSCLFLPKLAVSLLGHKWCMAWSLWGYILWMAANGYAVWATMIPASIILGIAAATLWTPQCSYFTVVAKEYALQTGEREDVIVTRFFGIFFCIFELSNIIGGIISSTVLTPAPDDIDEPLDEDLALCGQNDCPWTNHTNSNYDDPADATVWTLVGIYIAIGVLAFLICAFCVDNLPAEIAGINKDESRTAVMKRDFWATIKHMRHKEQLLLIPITLYSGFYTTYYGAEWNNSYVTCAIGIWMVGWTSICAAVLDSAMSFCSSHVVKWTGRVPLFSTALIVDVCYICLLLFWAPHPDDLWLFFFIPCLYGIADGIWQAQLNGLYGVLFPKDSEAAFSNYRLWESIGFTIAYGYSAHLCTDTKLYIVIGVLAVGFTCYATLEIYLRNKKETSYSLEVTDSDTSKIETSYSIGLTENYSNKVAAIGNGEVGLDDTERV